MKKSLLVLAILSFILVWAVSESKTKSVSLNKHDLRKMHHFFAMGQHNRAPIDPSEYFLNSFSCKGCHGFDPQGYALVDGAGNDVNIYDDWSTSMMALSAKDPLWRAKVSHEITVTPGNANEVQTLCTGCHAPTGHYTALYKGNSFYTIADLDNPNDSLGIDGVSCSGCHAISDVGLGSMFNGTIPYDTNDIIYGPYTNPVMGPMQLYEGMTPTYGEHTSQSRFCSPCHTLITNTVDLSGNYTGGKFIEQATYQEWVNSIYPANDSTCQICHMPQLEDPVVIAVGDINLPPRVPFNQHFFVGANSFMVKLMKHNKLALNIDHPDSSFDATLYETNKILTQNAVKMRIQSGVYASQDSLYVNVSAQNKAGHKFPSGYPSRRAFIQVVVIKSNGDTLFSSGLFNPDGELKYPPASWQPHYEFVNGVSQTQVYEMVMADVNGDRTTVLERAAYPLKDNRIPPRGFVTTHASYDTVKIIDNALTDPNFNKIASVEGSGKDITSYHIPLQGYVGQLNIYAKMYYQTLPPSWLTEMFALSTQPIDDFKAMYQNESNLPILIDADSIVNFVTNVGMHPLELQRITIYPNPSPNGWITVNSPDASIKKIEIYDLSGKLLSAKQQWPSREGYIIQLQQKSGTYLIRVYTEKGLITKKVIVN